MKRINRIIQIACLTLIVTSCSKSNKDFVGEYKTQFAADVVVENAKSYLASKGEVEFPTGFRAPDLTTIELKLYIDESTDKLSGQGTLNIPYLFESILGNSPKRTKKNFDVIGEHIVNDTLYFSMQLVSSSKRIDAYLIKDGDKSFIGLDKSYTSKIAQGPQFNIENGKYNQYITNDPELTQKIEPFILQQYKRNDSLITNSSESDFSKKRLSNANWYYNQAYLKK
jgi:hypothetical protein